MCYFMTNKFKSFSKESDLDNLPTIDDVGPLKELLYEKLDSAILSTRAHFVESRHRADVPGLFAKHVRSYLQDLLEPEAETYEFSIETPAGSFLVIYKNFVVRLYKAYNGKLPHPRRDSKSQLQFFNHNSKNIPWEQLLPGFETLFRVSAGARVHLIAYYDVGPKSELSWLRIACPLLVSSSGINCLWNELIENPLTSGAIQPKEHPKTTRPDIPFTLLEEDDLAEDNDDSIELG
jgi:hypothetical protein